MLYSDDLEEMFKVYEFFVYLDLLLFFYVDIGFLVFGLYLDFLCFRMSVLLYLLLVGFVFV